MRRHRCRRSRTKVPHSGDHQHFSALGNRRLDSVFSHEGPCTRAPGRRGDHRADHLRLPGPGGRFPPGLSRPVPPRAELHHPGSTRRRIEGAQPSRPDSHVVGSSGMRGPSPSEEPGMVTNPAVAAPLSPSAPANPSTPAPRLDTVVLSGGDRQSGMTSTFMSRYSSPWSRAPARRRRRLWVRRCASAAAAAVALSGSAVFLLAPEPARMATWEPDPMPGGTR